VKRGKAHVVRVSCESSGAGKNDFLGFFFALFFMAKNCKTARKKTHKLARKKKWREKNGAKKTVQIMF
jgi:hypothetical protein